MVSEDPRGPLLSPRPKRPWWREPLLVGPLLMAFIGTAGAVLLTDGARESGDLSAYDPATGAEFLAARSDVVTVLAQVLTFFGSTWALLPLTLALLVWLGLRRRWQSAAVVAIGMAMSLVLTVLLKNTVGRGRPPVVDVLGAIDTGYAFPSGHTLNGTVFYGLVIGLVLSWCRSAWARAAALGGGLTMALGIGLSRIYLGYHWLTDVLAGWSLAAVVLSVVLLGVVLLARHRGAPASGRFLPSGPT